MKSWMLLVVNKVYSPRGVTGGQQSLFVFSMELVNSIWHVSADDGSAAGGALCGLELSLRVGQLGSGHFPKHLNPSAYRMVFFVELLNPSSWHMVCFVELLNPYSYHMVFCVKLLNPSSYHRLCQRLCEQTAFENIICVSSTGWALFELGNLVLALPRNS